MEYRVVERPKVIKQLRLDARKKVESGKVQEEGLNKKANIHFEARCEKNSANYPQSTSNKRTNKSPSVNEGNTSVQDEGNIHRTLGNNGRTFLTSNLMKLVEHLASSHACNSLIIEWKIGHNSSFYHRMNSIKRLTWLE
ncbi:hypothetical protein LguiB_029796 [Lonicera macranthoides]